MASLRYRNPNSPRVLGVRVLKPEDLEFLREKSCVPPIKKLRESHHRIAMLLALGLTQKEVAERVGYTPTRVSILANTPSVKDLIIQYRKDVNADEIAQHRGFLEEKLDISRMGLRKIRDRFEEDDEAAEQGLAPGEGARIRDRDLAAITMNMLDSTGHGKVSMNVNVNVDFATRLEEARRRVAALSTPPSAGAKATKSDSVIDGIVEKVA